jgi:hypothetical protein
VKKVKTMLCTFVFSRFCTLWETYSSEGKGDKRKHQEKSSLGKNTKSGGSDPTFSASRRPKNFCGRSRPRAPLTVPVFFPRRRNEFRNHGRRRDSMPLIKKAPGIVSLEVKIEEPVKELLEDYARFIESTPDHVVNVVLKKNLWRDQDYRKWREQRRNQTSEAAKAAGQPRA